MEEEEGPILVEEDGEAGGSRSCKSHVRVTVGFASHVRVTVELDMQGVRAG